MSGFEPPPPPPSACSIRGSEDLVAVVSSAENGGVSLAHLGGFADWEMIALSGDSDTGRAKVRWSSGTPGISIEGWVEARELVFRPKHDVPLIPGHVWISAEASVTLRTDGGHAQIAPYSTPFANIRATVPCEDVQIGQGNIEPIVGAPAYWTSSQKTLSIYSAPKGTLLGALAYGAPFDATAYAAVEEKNGFLHLLHYDGLHIDAWVKTDEMKPWTAEPPQFPFVCGMGTLDIADKAAIVRTITDDTDVFLEASATSTRVGTIARGARVHVVTSKKSFVAIEGEHGRWRGPDGKKLWVRGAAVGP